MTDNRGEDRALRERVREILMQEWDPIGVRDVSTAQGEYDFYVGPIAVMVLDERTTAMAIEAYLFDIARDRMGLSARPELAERSALTAEILVSLRPRFETY